MLKNSTSIPLSVALALATDNYKTVSDPFYISATEILKPLKSLVLSRTITTEADTDIAELVPSRLGTAFHDLIEAAWKGDWKKGMKSLGMPPSVIDRIVINPKNTGLHPLDSLFIYMENRSFRKIGKWTIGGMYDFVLDGQLEDHKTTKTYSYIADSNADSYRKQGSIYRWLNPEIITKDTVQINYIFTDWIMVKSIQDKSYPQNNIIAKHYPLFTLEQTEAFLTERLLLIERYTDAPEATIPDCTKEELWQSDSVWKYFKNPNSRARSTKNFDNPSDANNRCASDGNVGVVVEVPGSVKRCKYCNAAPVCEQRAVMMNAGLIK